MGIGTNHVSGRRQPNVRFAQRSNIRSVALLAVAVLHLYGVFFDRSVSRAAADEAAPAVSVFEVADKERPDNDHPRHRFPAELVRFEPIEANPVFTAEGEGHWDTKIRERGWILRTGDVWRMWFTGFDGTRAGQKMLGYATSTDGVHWSRHPANPLHRDHWIEDMLVVERDGALFMFAEGRGDQPHLFRSSDGIAWTRVGPIDIRMSNGQPLSPGPRGTPTVWLEDGVWHLFYERYDKGVWLATSHDMKVWTNVSEDPVLLPGPGDYDRALIAMNQVIRHKGRYYAYYHGKGAAAPWDQWCTNVATSTDLRHWDKFPGNPLQPVEQNKSSGIVVHDGKQYRLYTMHDQVDMHLPVGQR